MFVSLPSFLIHVHMRVNVSKEQIAKVLADENASREAKVKVTDPWWVIALKVAAYLIGLLLAGSATTAAAATIMGAL